jgi:hypothetical protein
VKSSIARTFIIIETAPWIHPLYRGCLTLEIANVSNTPILLYPGRPIGQLVFLEISKQTPGKTEPKRVAKLSGSYLGPVYPGPPNLPDPADDLRQIGVPESEIKLPVTFEFSSTGGNDIQNNLGKLQKKQRNDATVRSTHSTLTRTKGSQTNKSKRVPSGRSSNAR